MKAIGGRGSIRMRQARENVFVDDPLTRRNSIQSAMTSASIYEDNVLDIVAPALVLCPNITITPEVPSMESGSCTLWVGVSITGKLRRADGQRVVDSLVQAPSTSRLVIVLYCLD